MQRILVAEWPEERRRVRWSTMKLLHIVVTELRLIWRDRLAVVFVLILPLVVITLVAEMEGGTGIVLAVVNRDQGPVADSLVAGFKEYVDVREMSRPAAERLVAVDNDAPAALVLPAGTSQRFQAGKPSRIELLTDPAQWQGLQAIRLIFLLAARKAETPDDPFGEKLLSIAERSLTTRQLTIRFLEQRIPGLTVMFVLFSLVLGLAFGVQEDKARRISYRLAIAPVSRVTLLGGKMLARVLVGSAQLFVLLGFGHVVYGLALGDSPVAIFAVGVCTVLSFAGFALVFATVVRGREQIIPLGLAAGLILAAVGGCWWSFYKQPRWLQFIGHGMMTSWAMSAIQDVMIRNRDLLSVAPKLLALLGQGLLWLVVAAGIMRRAEA